MKKKSRWTESKVALLTELWMTHSGAQIAKKLGKGFTRNCVVGKAWRLDLPPKPMGGPQATEKMKAALAAVARGVPVSAAAQFHGVNPGSLRTSVWRAKQKLTKQTIRHHLPPAIGALLRQ